MRARGTFEVAAFMPAEVTPPVPVTTALPVGVAGTGTYVAMEAFEGSLGGVDGGFCFVHAASTTGTDRNDEWFLIVPSSGTGGLAGIRGSGSMTNDHAITFDYELD